MRPPVLFMQDGGHRISGADTVRLPARLEPERRHAGFLSILGAAARRFFNF